MSRYKFICFYTIDNNDYLVVTFYEILKVQFFVVRLFYMIIIYSESWTPRRLIRKVRIFYVDLFDYLPVVDEGTTNVF